jgi:hypothetical protein
LEPESRRMLSTPDTGLCILFRVNAPPIMLG